jgi:hypothetical protein
MPGTGATTSGGLRIREAGFDDYEQIASLQAFFGLPIKSYQDWSRLWLGNPLYQVLASGWSIGWVLEDKRGRIVGSIGNVPLPYQWNGREIIAASGIAWVAEPAYRSAALMLLDRVINQPNVGLYLNNTVTKDSAAAVDVFACPRVPVGLWDETSFWITHCGGFSKAFLATKRLPAIPPLNYLASLATFLNDRVRSRRIPISDFRVEPCASFDDRFDDAWMDLCRRSPNHLLAVRSCEVLRWHLGDALRKGDVWVPVIADGRGIAAYAVFDRRDNGGFGLRRVRLVDFQSRESDRDAMFGALLAWALRRCREIGVHMLENVGRWLEKGEFIETYVPYRRKLPAWSYVYRARDAAVAENLKHRSAWSPSLFDGNASL